jgi:hypothetical protein
MLVTMKRQVFDSLDHAALIRACTDPTLQQRTKGGRGLMSLVSGTKQPMHYGTLLIEKIASFDENRRQQQAMSKRAYVGVGVIVMKGDQVLLILSRENW